MKVFNMIFVIGIALFVSISTILAAPDADEFVPKYPKILPGDLPFINSTSSDMCVHFSDFETTCGWIFYKIVDEGAALSFARIACLCPSDEQCEHIEDPSKIYIHNYKCTKRTSRSKVTTGIETLE